MNLTVIGNDGEPFAVAFANTISYDTNPETGELDIYNDEAVTIATFARGKWTRILRFKEDDEEWPEWAKDEDKVRVEEEDLGIQKQDGLFDVPGLKGIREPRVSYRGRGA